MNRIYLDHAATTPMHPLVIETMTNAMKSFPGNPSSIHDDGRNAKFAIEESREKVASLLGKEPSEIIFTSSATESINTVIKGFHFSKYPDKVLYRSSKVEHHATLHSLQYSEKKNAKIDWVKVNQFGEISDIENTFVDLNSFMIVNNELGTILNPEIAEKVKLNKQLLHLDGVQALGKIALKPYLEADFISFSGHKIRGPKGVGVLVVSSGAELEPLLHGGSHERNRRAGTESVFQISGFAKALEISLENRESAFQNAQKLNLFLRNELQKLSHFIEFNSPENGSPFILNFTFSKDEKEDIDGEALLMALDSKGISVSNGSACSSGSFEASHVLSEIGKTDYEAQATIRVSFSGETTLKEVTFFVETFDKVLKRMKEVKFV